MTCKGCSASVKRILESQVVIYLCFLLVCFTYYSIDDSTLNNILFLPLAIGVENNSYYLTC